MKRRVFIEMIMALVTSVEMGIISQAAKLIGPSKGEYDIVDIPDPYEIKNTSSLREIRQHIETIVLDFNELVCVHMDLYKGNPDDLEIEFVWPEEDVEVIDSMLLALQYTGSMPAKVILWGHSRAVRTTITQVGIRYGTVHLPTIVCFVLHYEGEWE